MAWTFMLLISTLVFLYELVTNFKEKVLNARKKNTTIQIGKIGNDIAKVIEPNRKNQNLNGAVRPKY